MSDPIPGTGRRTWHRPSSPGVSASSRVVQHHYADEGDKGRWIRRLVRRREAKLWNKEYREEAE